MSCCLQVTLVHRSRAGPIFVYVSRTIEITLLCCWLGFVQLYIKWAGLYHAVETMDSAYSIWCQARGASAGPEVVLPYSLTKDCLVADVAIRQLPCYSVRPLHRLLRMFSILQCSARFSVAQLQSSVPSRFLPLIISRSKLKYRNAALYSQARSFEWRRCNMRTIDSSTRPRTSSPSTPDANLRWCMHQF